MARQAKTSLFSGLESVAPTYTHIHTHAHIHQHRYPFQIGVARRQSVLLSEIEIPAPGHLDGCPWVSVCLRSLSVLAGCTWSPKVKLGKISIQKHLSNPQLMLASAKAFTQLAFHWGCVLRSFFSFFSIICTSFSRRFVSLRQWATHKPAGPTACHGCICIWRVYLGIRIGGSTIL